ncbi:hypothetical protein LIER_07873 [Lithospermum erythrorhizon]|uniref:Uncharacterized protein n=1 Tax=Lithospermum erythrorhizon TaxID=34254 RepID=A0AAV3P9U1_LITER
MQEGREEKLSSGGHTCKEASRVYAVIETHMLGVSSEGHTLTRNNTPPAKGWKGRHMPFSREITKILLIPGEGELAYSVARGRRITSPRGMPNRVLSEARRRTAEGTKTIQYRCCTLTLNTTVGVDRHYKMWRRKERRLVKRWDVVMITTVYIHLWNWKRK